VFSVAQRSLYSMIQRGAMVAFASASPSYRGHAVSAAGRTQEKWNLFPNPGDQMSSVRRGPLHSRSVAHGIDLERAVLDSSLLLYASQSYQDGRDAGIGTSLGYSRGRLIRQHASKCEVKSHAGRKVRRAAFRFVEACRLPLSLIQYSAQHGTKLVNLPKYGDDD
jgi:hypothetical protein